MTTNIIGTSEGILVQGYDSNCEHILKIFMDNTSNFVYNGSLKFLSCWIF